MIIGAALGLMGLVAVLAWLAGRWQERVGQQEVLSEKALLEQSLASERDRNQELTSRLEDVQAQQEHWRDQCQERDTRLARLDTLREEERRNAEEKLALLERNRDALKQEFENLANRIFDEKNSRFSEQTQSNLSQLLNPFREQLHDFRRRVDTLHENDSKDRQALKTQIEGLQQLNKEITQEASNLTQALRGDKKIQGNWGELILERVLEKSGLRKGMEYETQGSYRNDSGDHRRPDVVVHLPDSRNVVVDSKVSLVSYQEYVTAEEDDTRLAALRAHVDAVRQHIRTLSDKNYSELSGLESPDFVLMFMPIEPAFIAAFQHDDQLFADAFDRKVVVVTPTTLLATLRTIENIWRYERQSQNARKIAERAGAVYDKLRVFVEAMEQLGKQMDTAQKTYEGAMNTLTHGRGNLISQASRFVDLGVRVKKELPRSVMEQAELGDAGEESEGEAEKAENGTSVPGVKDES